MNPSFLAIAALSTGLGTTPIQSQWQTSGSMEQVLRRYSTDRAALDRLHTFEESPTRRARLRAFYEGWIEELDRVDFDNLGTGGKADWIALKNRLRYLNEKLEFEEARLEEAGFLMPFLNDIVQLHEQRMSKGLPDPEKAGASLSQLIKSIDESKKSLEAKVKASSADKVAAEPIARRAVNALNNSRRSLNNWYEHFSGYDPLFTWWTKRPYEDAGKKLASYTDFIRDTFVPSAKDEKAAIVGDPIGEKALQRELDHEMIPYTPNELIEIAKKEMDWCNKEMIAASKELGFGDDWRKALEHVKTLHVEPGKQPQMVVELAQEAIDYLETNDLLTIPPLAKELWRLDMMSPERQLIAPFFLGGETIIVSFPTDTMTHDQKLMSMRANNRYFSKATVHHELIPGHHLQGFMTSRFNTHRRGVINTPFWVEGWALYWEFLLYKRKFAATPEERIGFLFWRKHRCARIIFSLSYHMGSMTANECVEMLVNDVGHERSTAEGEVRRSFGGDYPPLYQAAYMLVLSRSGSFDGNSSIPER
ncbi:DUF885 family protein [Geitlerinema splendidum]|nr:DUF885 family protein [Geitlerinema splendidum]